MHHHLKLHPRKRVICPTVPTVLFPLWDGTVCFRHRLSPSVHLSACKIAPLAVAPCANLHIFYPPDPQGKPLLRKRLRRGSLQSVSDCRGFRPSKQKPTSGSKALCFLPASGRSSAPAAPALRQASGRALRARPHGSRDDGDRLRVAVMMIATQSFYARDDCTSSLSLSQLLYRQSNAYILPLYLRHTVLAGIDTLRIIILSYQCNDFGR